MLVVVPQAAPSTNGVILTIIMYYPTVFTTRTCPCTKNIDRVAVLSIYKGWAKDGGEPIKRGREGKPRAERTTTGVEENSKSRGYSRHLFDVGGND